MKHLLIGFFFLLILPIGSNGQVQSSSQITPELYNAYQIDIYELAINRIFESNSPAQNQINIPQIIMDTIWDGLAAVYNAYPLAARDSVFDIYCIHQVGYLPYEIYYSIGIKPDISYPFASMWASGLTLTGNADIDNLLSTYGFTLTSYINLTDWAFFNTSSIINIYAFCEQMNNIPGILDCEPQPVFGDGNNIVYSKVGDMQYFDFSVGYGDCYTGCGCQHTWSFEVNYTTKVVNYLGVQECPFNYWPIPGPYNCNLSSNIPSYSYFDYVICSGDSAYMANAWYNSSVSFNDTLITSQGSDSILYYNLTVQPGFNTYTEYNLCDGDSMEHEGQVYYNNYFGSEINSSQLGCDSTLYTAIFFHDVSDIYDTVGFCAGSSYYFNYQYINQPGDYYVVLPSVFGCDSMVHLNLFEVQPYMGYDTVQICDNSSYDFGGQLLSNPGDYAHNFTSQYHCDSIINLHLIALPEILTHDSLHLCDNEEILFNSQILNLSGDYYQTLYSVSGCDSIVHLNLQVNPTSQDTVEAFICEGEVYSFQGQEFSSTGLYSHWMNSQQGCDSTLYLNLDVYPLPFIEFLPPHLDSVFINNVLVDLPAVIPTGGIYSGLGVMGNSFFPQIPGLGDTWIYYQAEDSNGCTGLDSFLVSVVSAINIQKLQEDGGLRVYPNPVQDLLYIEFKDVSREEVIIQLFSIEGSQRLENKTTQQLLQLDLSQFANGCYFLRIESEAGVSTTFVVKE